MRKAGVPLPPNTPPPAEYYVGSKHAEDKTKRNPAGVRGVEGWPCVCLNEHGEYHLRTLKWGIQQLSTHNIWCEADGEAWLTRKNWKEALEAGRLCAVAVTAFAEGVTCRMADDAHSPLFFLAGLFRGDKFVLLTTNSTTVPLLRERALQQAEHGVPSTPEEIEPPQPQPPLARMRDASPLRVTSSHGRGFDLHNGSSLPAVLRRRRRRAVARDAAE